MDTPPKLGNLSIDDNGPKHSLNNIEISKESIKTIFNKSITELNLENIKKGMKLEDLIRISKQIGVN
jgi:hypothetical protein